MAPGGLNRRAKPKSPSMSGVEIILTRTAPHGIEIVVSERIEAVVYGVLTGAGVPCERPRPLKKNRSILEIRRDDAPAFGRRRSPLRWVEAHIDKGLQALDVGAEKTVEGNNSDPSRIRWSFDMHAVLVGSSGKDERLTKPLLADQRKPDVLHQLSEPQIQSTKTRSPSRSRRRRNGD